MKKQYISDLKVGTFIDSLFVVSKKLIKKKKNNEDYCVVTLQDKEGSIEAVIWTEAFRNTEDFGEGDFVSVRGDVSEYRGGKQLTISFITKVKNKEDIEYSDFIRTTKEDTDGMFSEIKSYIGSIGNHYLKKLLNLFFEDKDFVRSFCHATAASMYHHAYMGGLLEHTLSVTKICDFLSGVYSNLNRDLLISGAILHDIGKIREYEVGVIIKVTDEGKLLGHITIGYGWILEKIKQIGGFPEDLKERILHMILSHHGHKEFGSPRRPKILEAFVLYHVDHMDADVGGYNIILEKSREGEDWSAFAKNFERSVMLKKLKLNAIDQEHIDIDNDNEEKRFGVRDLDTNIDDDNEEEKFNKGNLSTDKKISNNRNEENLAEKVNTDKAAKQKDSKQDGLF